VTSQAGALDGIVIADFSRVLAGPFSTMLLGDLGAEVIKVERPGVGDDTRGFGPPFVDGEASYYLSANRNKRSIELDLTDPDGRDLARRLVLASDVVVENFMPGSMRRFGLDYDELAGLNRGLVWCSITGFGSEGKGAELPGYDFVAQGLGGLMSITGEPGGEPLKAGFAIVDVLAALFATTGVLAALRHRERTGEGQRVEVNLMSSILCALANQSSTFVTTGRVPTAMGNKHPSIAPYETFHASDRPFIVAVGNDRQFARLARVVGEGWMSDDERFATNPARVVNREELHSHLEKALATNTAAHWVEALTEASIPCGLVNDISEAFGYAEQLGLGPIIEIQRPNGGSTRHAANPVRLSGTPVSYRTAPPRLGEDRESILTWLDERQPKG
jgi:crotonobetainyl-CoA:carnitine CoA-transferase CaiB-like acyl-CoA transferase